MIMNDIVSKAHHLSLASEDDITKHRLELFFNHSDFLPRVPHNPSPILPSQTTANTSCQDSLLFWTEAPLCKPNWPG